jgi:hypothetical protein
VRVMVMLVLMLTTAEFFGVCGIAAGQNTNEKESQSSTGEIANLPMVGGRHSRPKLSLESALRIAQRSIRKNTADGSSYWLYEVHFSLYGDQNMPPEKKSPCWAFRWVKDVGVGSVGMVVFMDGKPMEIPRI